MDMDLSQIVVAGHDYISPVAKLALLIALGMATLRCFYVNTLWAWAEMACLCGAWWLWFGSKIT